MSGELRAVIRRADGRWYVGVADHNAVFVENGLVAASYTPEAGEKRAESLRRQGHDVEIVQVLR